MAPLLSRRDDLDVSAILKKPWVMALIILGGVMILSLTTFMAVYCLRRERAGSDEEQLPALSPQSSAKDFLPRRKMSAAVRAEMEEQERALIIRKSLASRHSSFSGSLRTLDSMQRSSMLVDEGLTELTEEPETIEEHRDWKEFEAGLRRQRANSDLGHPALQDHHHHQQQQQQQQQQQFVHPALLSHPAVSSEFEEISIIPRAPSPVRWGSKQSSPRYSLTPSFRS
ncbi:hypothetical protein BX600DRAFT_105332 [Xylariales sp. PMI_506]|nr:hypothetical protein BX600DRAFT_105332 [Xylariales sp. PMI_506]